MKDVILERCCGNCEWSISPIDEEEIMRENHYEEEDPTRPRAGDCCLGMEHNENYFCNCHEYVSGGLDTYVFYDDKYLGPGYFVVIEYYGYILKFLKLYRTGEYNNDIYGFRVYEFDPIIKVINRSNKAAKDILFEITKVDNEKLYTLSYDIANKVGNNVIRSFDNLGNFMTMDINKYSVSINFTEIIEDKDKISNYIDIKVSNIMDERIYKLIDYLYKNMAVITENKGNEETLKKVRSLYKN